jgi:hypothetical protein
MAGLDPAIHVNVQLRSQTRALDGRLSGGYDEI